MKINKLKNPNINQNGYHKNILTRERIGTLFIYPIDFTPDDCLSCDGYSLLIVDFEELYKVIGTKFNKNDDTEGTFRIPDYNITGRFLQPGSNVGNQIAAGLPNITGAFNLYGVEPGRPVAGAFWETISGSNISHHCGAHMNIPILNFNASRCSAIYGKSSTVQPLSQIVHICIKYK